MKAKRNQMRIRVVSCILLAALLLSVCGSILCTDHVCDDPCCVICRFAELRRQLAWAVLSMAVAAFGPGLFRLTGIRRSAPRQRFFTLVSCSVQLND
ncbi:MAG: hypothetical protein Q4G06_09195 [Clostridia bacterium]|nr:hypothetical protein [Clostridia bacterium]